MIARTLLSNRGGESASLDLVFEVTRHWVTRRWFSRPWPTRQWRWRLRASNGKIIAVSSESYVRREDCIRSIELVRGVHEAVIRFE